MLEVVGDKFPIRARELGWSERSNDSTKKQRDSRDDVDEGMSESESVIGVAAMNSRNGRGIDLDGTINANSIENYSNEERCQRMSDETFNEEDQIPRNQKKDLEGEKRRIDRLGTGIEEAKNTGSSDKLGQSNVKTNSLEFIGGTSTYVGLRDKTKEVMRRAFQRGCWTMSLMKMLEEMD